VNRYQVRISVMEHKPVQGPGAVFGQKVADKLLDASVTTDQIGLIRTIVDGLLFEGIPDTQREDEKEDPVVASGGRWVSSPARPDPISDPLFRLARDGASGQFVIPPTVDADLPPVKTPIPEGEELKGGKHSGNCSCSRCEPPEPEEPVLFGPVVPRPVRDDPQA
jgi:hypothetical protein